MNLDAIPRERLPQLLHTMPKAELHIHIEPELIFELAQRNGMALAYPSVAARRAAYAFTDLQSFALPKAFAQHFRRAPIWGDSLRLTAECARRSHGLRLEILVVSTAEIDHPLWRQLDNAGR